MLAKYRAIDRCRLCENTELVPVLSLGTQCMTGLFPRADAPAIAAGPLELVKCHGSDSVCGLLQLKHSYDGDLMYGQEYGYRSSLNRGMVQHLRTKAENLQRRVALRSTDIVLDIGSNDGTSLSFYPKDGPTLIGIDPTSRKFLKYYQPHIRAIPEFFSAMAFRKAAGSDDAKARIVTSIAMFYDLEDPLQFMREIHDILADDGVWHFEQSYMPSMLAATAYDTVCHEHIEYYSLKQIAWMCDRVGLRITDVEFNDVNGGSFAVTVEKANPSSGQLPEVARLLAEEEQKGFSTLLPFAKFSDDVFRHRTELTACLTQLRAEGRRVFGLGASTKGNVILQFCELGPREIEFIAEVNEEKFGCVTPGTRIPIISEAEAQRLKPDTLFVLPWHFREHFLRAQEPFMNQGGRLLFPLPRLQFVPE